MPESDTLRLSGCMCVHLSGTDDHCPAQFTLFDNFIYMYALNVEVIGLHYKRQFEQSLPRLAAFEADSNSATDELTHRARCERVFVSKCVAASLAIQFGAQSISSRDCRNIFFGIDRRFSFFPSPSRKVSYPSILVASLHLCLLFVFI